MYPQRSRKVAEILNISETPQATKGPKTPRQTKRQKSPPPAPPPQATKGPKKPRKTTRQESPPPAPPPSPAPDRSSKVSNVDTPASDKMDEMLKVIMGLGSRMNAVITQVETISCEVRNLQKAAAVDSSPMEIHSPIKTKATPPSQSTQQATTPTRPGAAPIRPVPSFNRMHLGDVTPLTDYLRLELDQVRLISREGPGIKARKDNKGPRQLVVMYFTAKPRLDIVGQVIPEPSCLQLSIWGPVGEVVPDAPHVGDVLRVRGFNASVATAPFNKWHPVELVSSFAELRFEKLPDDDAIPWEKSLNPYRTIQDRQVRNLAPVQQPFTAVTPMQQQYNAVPLQHAVTNVAPMQQQYNGVPVQQQYSNAPTNMVPMQQFGPMTAF